MLPGRDVVNVLIIDDEAEACVNLNNILAEYVDDTIHVVGMANSAKEAERKIAQLRPHAVFLDIEMPNENAFAFLARIAPFDFEVIFVTAYDEYAIKAFKLNAIDYILKPISIYELKAAIGKLKEKIRYRQIVSDRHNPQYLEVATQLNNKTKIQKITLKDSNSIEVVDFKDIYYIEAQGSYVKIVFLKNEGLRDIVLSGSLTDYEEMMPPDLFYRIHKSYLINCLHIRKILRDEHNYVVIKDAFTLPVSRRRFPSLMQFLRSNDYYHE